LTLNVPAVASPAGVTSLTLSLPGLAFAGTLHVMRVALQLTYLAHGVEPNTTRLAPRRLPNPLPVIVSVAPRRADAGVRCLGLGGTRLAAKRVACATVNRQRPPATSAVFSPAHTSPPSL
jgi:hypothetical protein